VNSGTDDYNVDYLSEEEETEQLGGEGFTPQQLAEAEKRFQDQLVSLSGPLSGIQSTDTTCTRAQNWNVLHWPMNSQTNYVSP